MSVAQRAAPLLPSTLAEVWEAIGDDGPLPSTFADAAARHTWVEAEFEFVADVLVEWVREVGQRDGVPYVLDVSGWIGTIQDYSRGDRPMGCCYRSQLGTLPVQGAKPPEAHEVACVYWTVQDPLTHRQVEFMLMEQVRRFIVGPAVIDAEAVETTPDAAGLVGGDVSDGRLFEAA